MRDPSGDDAFGGGDALGVLVVDDNPGTRSGLAQLLRLRGYEALEAQNGSEALQVLREHPETRVVVLDLNMPGGSGYSFREQQLKDPTIAEIPAIVFTGSGDVPDVAFKFHDVLRKPISVDALLDAVRRCCETQ